MPKKWEVRTIQRNAKTAKAQLQRALDSGFELYETNARHYKLRRPWSEAAATDEVDEHSDEEAASDEE